MIIHGGEPPFIETPEPKFGEVLLRLDEMAYNLEQSVYSFNESTKQKLLLFNQNLSSFVTEVVGGIEAHVSQVGAVHGETKKTIRLPLKDNYRTATPTDLNAASPVYAYATPLVSRQAFVNRNANNPFVASNYQQNDLLQFASYYYLNEFPVMTPSAPQVTRYFQQGPVGMVINDDRIVYSPVSNSGIYETQIGFVSAPTNNRRSSRLSEILNMSTRFLPNGWNSVGAVAANQQVALFKPLADKKIFLYKDQLGMGPGGRDFLLYSSYIGTVYKGLTAKAQVNSDFTFTLYHMFFYVNAFDSDPTLTALIGSGYAALYTNLNQAPFVGSLNGSHSYDIRNFVNLQAGQTIRIGGTGLTEDKVVVSLMWESQDHEIYMHVAVPVIVESAQGSKELMISFILSIIPGSLVSGGSGTVRQLGTLVKDTVLANLNPASNSQWLSLSDPFDINSPLHLPGVVLESGDILKSLSTRNALRIKRYNTGFAGLKAWVQGPRSKVDAKIARTEMFSPSRHTPFGPVPERIIPITNLNGVTKYLVYGLDNEKGYYRWAEFSWNSESIVGSDFGAYFGIRYSTESTPYPSMDKFPRGLTAFASQSSAGVGFNSLVFTTENGYKAYSSFGYAAGVVTLGAEVRLSPSNLVTLQAAGSKVMANAKALNPAVPDALRELQIQVFALELNKAVIVISDGYSYAEGMIAPYAITGDVFILNFNATSGLNFARLTPQFNSVNGTHRESKSGDGVWSASSDLLACKVNPTTYNVVVTRPFGKLYGDISFLVSLYSSNIPTMTPVEVNPGRLYSGLYQIDVVESIFPPVLIPGRGVFQNLRGGQDNQLVEIGGTSRVTDPYETYEAGWVRIPAGSKVVILGRVYMLDRDYPIKVNPTGRSYCYLQRVGNTLVALASSVMREVNNSEVMFGIAESGVLTVNSSYIVIDKHVISATRHGSSIPVFEDNGGLGVNQFFTQRDVG